MNWGKGGGRLAAVACCAFRATRATDPDRNRKLGSRKGGASRPRIVQKGTGSRQEFVPSSSGQAGRTARTGWAGAAAAHGPVAVPVCKCEAGSQAGRQAGGKERESHPHLTRLILRGLAAHCQLANGRLASAEGSSPPLCPVGWSPSKSGCAPHSLQGCLRAARTDVAGTCTQAPPAVPQVPTGGGGGYLQQRDPCS